MVTPVLVALAVVIGYPVINALWMSLTSDASYDDSTGTQLGAGEFVGLANYTKWFFQQCSQGTETVSCASGTTGSQFWSALGITLFFTVVTVGLEVAIGLWMATIMGKTFSGRAVLRAAVLVPWAIPTAVTSKLWGLIFNVDGVLNRILGTQILWTTEEWPARFAVIIADVWKTTPFMALLILAGLQIIPQEVYEAARVDGATAWQRFTQITLPLVKPALMVAILFRTMDALRMYDLPAILTGDLEATRTISMLVVQDMLSTVNSASALSTITFVLIFAIAFVMVKVLGANTVAGTKVDQ